MRLRVSYDSEADGSTLDLFYDARLGLVAIRLAPRQVKGERYSVQLRHVIEREEKSLLARELRRLWNRDGAIRWTNASLGRSETRRALSSLVRDLSRELEVAVEDLRYAGAEHSILRDLHYICDNALAFIDRVAVFQAPGERVRHALLRARSEIALWLLQNAVEPEALDQYRDGLSDTEGVRPPEIEMAESSFRAWAVEQLLDESIPVLGHPVDDLSIREREVLRAAFQARTAVGGRQDLTPVLTAQGNALSVPWLEALERWWLSVYDLASAARAHLQRNALERPREGYRSEKGWIERLYQPSAAFFLAVLGFLCLPFVLGLMFYDTRTRVIFDVGAAMLVSGIYGLTGWFLFWRLLARRSVTFFNLACPRLFASIIVGYVPILVVEETWGIAATLHPATLAIICPALLTVTFLYLYMEAKRRLGRIDRAFQRAMMVLLMGLTESFAIGLAALNLVAPTMLETLGAVTRRTGRLPSKIGLDTDALAEHMGWLGKGLEYLDLQLVVYPREQLLFACGALFVGVFLQLLWEDKQFTEPI